MSGAPMDFDRIIPEETQGSHACGGTIQRWLPGSLDSFQHVEAVMKDENVSTGTLDSQDWEMVTDNGRGHGERSDPLHARQACDRP